MMKKVHINMCPILDGYGVMTVFNSRTRPRVNLTEPAGGSSTQLSRLFLPATDSAVPYARFTTERQPMLRPAVAFSQTSFKHR
jgi:hypothetical protein